MHQTACHQSSNTTPYGFLAVKMCLPTGQQSSASLSHEYSQPHISMHLGRPAILVDILQKGADLTRRHVMTPKQRS